MNTSVELHFGGAAAGLDPVTGMHCEWLSGPLKVRGSSYHSKFCLRRSTQALKNFCLLLSNQRQNDHPAGYSCDALKSFRYSIRA